MQLNNNKKQQQQRRRRRKQKTMKICLSDYPYFYCFIFNTFSLKQKFLLFQKKKKKEERKNILSI